VRTHELRPAAANSGGDALSVESVVAPPQLLRTVVDVLVGYAEHLELDARTAFVQELRDRGAEATRDDVLLDRDKARRSRREREQARSRWQSWWYESGRARKKT